MARPSKLPVWNTSEANATEPPSSRQTDGWAITAGVPEKPPVEWHNYIWNLQYKWIDYLDTDKADKSNVLELDNTTPFTPNNDYEPATKIYVDQINGSFGTLSSPLLDLPLQNSLSMKAGVGSVDFTRASTATYVDRYGVLQTASIDEPRFEKDGLLIEGASTNYFKHSDTCGRLVNGNGNSGAVTIEDISPNGNLSQSLLWVEDTTANTAHYISGFGSDHPITAGETYTMSAFVKASPNGNKRYPSLILYLGSDGGAKYANQVFDLETGSKGTPSESAISSTIKKLADGWYKISVTGVCVETQASNNACQVRFQPTFQLSYYDGDGVSGGYVFGAQLEQLPFASSYIPTTDSAVTRAKDIDEITLRDNFGGWTNPFSISFEYEPIEFNNGVNNMVFATGNITSFINFTNNGSIAFRVSEGNVANGSETQVQQSTKVVCTSDGSITKLYLDGELIDSGTVGTNHASEQNIYIGHDLNGNQQVDTNIKNFKIYDKVLSDTEVKLLSGGN